MINTECIEAKDDNYGIFTFYLKHHPNKNRVQRRMLETPTNQINKKMMFPVFGYAENSEVVDLVLLDLSYILVPQWPLDFTIWRHEERDTDIWGA